MNILVTGASQGIGKAIALLFLERGHTVYGFDVQTATITHPRYTHYEVDIRNAEDYPILPAIEVLVNNAGVQNQTLPHTTATRGLTDAEGAQYAAAHSHVGAEGVQTQGTAEGALNNAGGPQAVTAHSMIGTEDIEVNLKGTIALTEHYGITPTIRSIVMIGSASGHTGSEFPEYAASKGGVLAYTKNVAMRVAPYGATCNSLDFGGVMTELNAPVMEDEALWNEIMALTPLRRWMTPEEAAEWVYFMAVTNRFCTGQNILIDGLEAGNAHFVWPS